MRRMQLTFPSGCIECMAGDYLIGQDWLVFRVDDLLSVSRLVALDTQPITLMAEDTLLDSMTPAYFGEAHLLLTAFDPVFADETAARQAILGNTLVERARGLLRSARDFPKDAWQVVRSC
jgi:hypothetical protein